MSIRSSAGPKRVRLSPEERRLQLITLGAEMLADRSLEEVSVDDIAKQAGISRGLLFHYFASKQEFHEAIARHVSTEFFTAIMPNRELSLFDMLRDSIERFVDYATEHSASYRSVLRGPASVTPDMADYVNETRAAIADLIVSELPLPPEDPDLARLTLAIRGWIAFVEETILTWMVEKPIGREDLVDLLVESLPALALSPALIAALRG
ncbi:TetR/AcrR family transcriptional regulator [Nocardia mangyaensis]|uniref:TetR/AcrR family transcriptional regulator n=1 Tax=Nocardia mangyaensis TaxID=2213200 RepID=UPI002676AF4B|nr:TetR/AcrR family transcriptional regulator [Nocardia mangyaensis]MDO3645382.1 TetR/AcrR family transcriptional regulator [Nocardia mangyaensis]